MTLQIQIKVGNKWLYFNTIEYWMKLSLLRKILLSLPRFYFLSQYAFIKTIDGIRFFDDKVFCVRRYKPLPFSFSKEDLKKGIKDTLKLIEQESNPTFSKELDKSLNNKEKEAWRQKLLRESKETGEYELLVNYLKKL